MPKFKLYSLLGVFALLFFVILYCEKIPTENEEADQLSRHPSRESFKNPYISVGTEHNVCLDIIYSYLHDHKDRLTKKDSIDKYIKLGTGHFLSKRKSSDCSVLKHKFRDAYNIVKQTHNYRKGLTKLSALDSIINKGMLSKFEAKYARRMDKLMGKISSNAAFEDSIKNIMIRVIAKRGARKSKALLVYGSVLIKSNQYWSANMGKWSKLFPSPLSKITADDKDNWKEADAVTGMVATFGCAGSLFGWAPCVVASSALASAAVFAWDNM